MEILDPNLILIRPQTSRSPPESHGRPFPNSYLMSGSGTLWPSWPGQPCWCPSDIFLSAPPSQKTLCPASPVQLWHPGNSVTERKDMKWFKNIPEHLFLDLLDIHWLWTPLVVVTVILLSCCCCYVLLKQYPIPNPSTWSWQKRWLWTTGKGGQSMPHSHWRGCSGAGWELQVPWRPYHQQTIMVQTHQDSREEGTTTPIPPQ